MITEDRHSHKLSFYISEWLLSNKLSLNIQKTKYTCIVFHTNQSKVLHSKLYLNTMETESCTQFNFRYCFEFSSKGNEHTDLISKKISKANGLMY